MPSGSNPEASAFPGQDRHPAARQASPVEDAPGAPARPLRAGSPEYRRDYNNGWRAAQRGAEDAADRAEGRSVSHAWHDGHEDYTLGNPKWTKRDERLAGDHEPEPADPSEAGAHLIKPVESAVRSPAPAAAAPGAFPYPVTPSRPGQDTAAAGRSTPRARTTASQPPAPGTTP